jgi:ubiquinone/menaquinone biosynthesis C-methylase UbiE
MPLTQRLWHTLIDGERVDAFVCEACGRRFPTYNRVVDLYGFVPATSPAVSDVDRAVALARPVAAALDLPDSEPMIATVAEVLGRTASMSTSHDEFDAEIRDIADRFGIDAGLEPDSTPEPPPPPAPSVLDVRVERHYIPAQLPPGAQVTCNVRFHNHGTEPFSSTSAPPVTIGFRWFDAGEKLVMVPEQRTRFPIVMAAGRAVTVPVEITAPAEEGVYTLVVCLVIENRCWVPESGVATTVTVEWCPAPPDVLDLQPDSETLAYADDHEVARLMLEGQATHLLATPGRRILEIGGGAAPQISWFGAHDAVNVDINLPLLELGSLWYAQNATDQVSERLAFLCADATDLPFEAETFDIIAMFATLHHFPEPEVLLRELRRLIHADGFVAVLCEPVGDTLETTDTLRDLKKGINEQVFTAAEYTAIFAAAGLEPIAGTQVGGSLRVFLRRCEPSGVSFTDVATVPPGLVAQLRPAAATPESPPARARPATSPTLGRVWHAITRRVRQGV